jgi:diaminohydroxyphosphoribosylaminopyrimidine deaminase/5-amino-6-(5-phosphoribosylamino)uracil reductase
VYCLEAENGRLALSSVMALLGRLCINEVLIEAGPTLNGALLAGTLVDEWLIYMATCVLGDRARGLFAVPDLVRMADKKQLKLRDVRQVGPDLRLILN